MKKYDSYKDSGVETLGQIPTTWEVTRLKYLGNAFGGLTYSPNDIVENENDGILVLRSSNIQNDKLSLADNVYVNTNVSEKLTLRKGDILICSRNGSKRLIGKNICIDERMEGNTFGAFMMVFRSDYWKFLYQFFNSPIFTSQSALFLTATINQLTSNTLNNFYLGIPSSIEEQTQIANYLDYKTTKIDDLIGKKEQLIELLKEERTAIINQAVTKGLDPNVPMKDSGIEWLGDIPEHWEIKRIRFVFDIIKNISGELGYDVLSITQQGIKIKDTTSGAGQLSMDYSKYQIVEKGDFAMNHMDLLTGFIDKSKFIGVTSPDYRVFRSKSTEGESAYFLYIFQMCYYNKIFFPLGQGSAQAGRWRLPTIQFRNFRIPVPPIDEQKNIVKYIENEFLRIDKACINMVKEIELLKEYKTALISEVVTGKVDVRDEKIN